MIELEPCPFCGGKADTGIELLSDFGHCVLAKVFCPKCNIQRSIKVELADKNFDGIISALNMACTKWNERVE